MSRTVRSASLDTRTARSRLAPERKHWHSVDAALHVGYRRGPRGGAWYARRFTDGRYVEKGLGTADDRTDGDGVAVLTYRAACDAAQAWKKSEERRALGLGDAMAGPYTVDNTCDDYLAWYIARGGKAERATRTTVDVHIRPNLGAIEVAKLTHRRIRQWHYGLATAPKRVRTGRLATEQAVRAVDSADPEAMRSRRATANRVLTVLKAALNHAWHEHHVVTDEAWRSVKPFERVDAAVVRYLDAVECRRLVNACEPGLRNLVRGALLTGARYGELCRLRAGDVDHASGTIVIREAKGGKSRHVVLTDEGAALFEALTAGRLRTAPVFLRDDGAPWKAAQATRPLTQACQRASISPAIGFHVLRHTYATTLALNGVAMRVIADQLGHADTRITEKHYAHLTRGYIATTIRAQFPTLGITEPTSVTPFHVANR